MRRPRSASPVVWRWLFALTPAALGIIASILWQRTLSEAYVPQLYLRADLPALSWLCGVFLSLVWIAALGVGLWTRHRTTQEVAATRQRAAEERRRFLRRLDHELKNPLTAIQAALANLAYADAGEGQAEPLESVKAQTQRMGALVADLRKLAELETRPLEFGPVNLTELLEEATMAARDQPEADERALTLTVPRAPWPLPEISGDWDLIFLAVYNLLSNALKFTQPGDTIELRASEDGRNVIIEVADTGPGISAEEQALVWEELYRAEAARGIPGSGLGLALVRAVVARHGGRATLRSRPGQGTVVTLRLPMTQE